MKKKEMDYARTCSQFCDGVGHAIYLPETKKEPEHALKVLKSLMELTCRTYLESFKDFRDLEDFKEKLKELP